MHLRIVFINTGQIKMLFIRDVVLGTCTCTRVVFEYKFEVLVLVLVLVL